MESIKQTVRRVFKIIVLVVFLGAAGGVALYVWQSKNKTDQSLNNASQGQGTVVKDTKNTESTAPKVQGTDLTADWTAVSSAKGKFSFRFPKTWVQPVNRDLCSPELFDRAVYLGPDADSVLKCATEYFGQVSVFSVDGDKRGDYGLNSGYKQVIDKEVNVNGLIGHRISGVATAPAPGAAFGPVEGTIEVRYVFYAPTGTTYVAKYTQAPKGNSPSTNVLNDFDIMVTKTLKFTP